MSRSRPPTRPLLAALATAALALSLMPSAPSHAGADEGRTTASSSTRPPAPARIDLPRGFQPEGIASDVEGRYYVGSLAGRGIATGSLRTGGTSILVRLPGTSLRGMTIDPRTGHLWVVGSRGDRGIVRVLDPDATRKVVARIRLPRAVFPNDLAFSANAAYVTDSGRHVLYRVSRPRRGVPAVVTTLALRGQTPAPVAGDEIALNGIRTIGSGRLLTVDSRDGALYAVSPRTGRTALVPARGSRRLRSGDGMVRMGERVYVVRGRGGNEIVPVRIVRRPRGLVAVAGRALHARGLDVPSTATRDRGALWAVNARFGVDTRRYYLTRVPLG